MATHIQTKANDGNGVSTIAAVMDSNVTAGNRLVVLTKLSNDFTPAAGQVTDSLGNTYTLDWSEAAAAAAGVAALADYAVFSTVSGSTGACTVTFNPAVSGRIAIAVREYSGLAAHDGTNRGVTLLQTSTTPLSPDVTPTSADGVFFAFVSSSQSQTWEADYGDATTEVSGGRFWTATDPNSSTSAQSATSTQVSTPWDCGLIWYADTSGGSGVSVAWIRG